jgi:hypothetical protein
MKLHTLFCFLAFAFAQIASASTLTNESVIKMVKADLDADTIILAIQKGDNNFDTSVDGLVALKSAGVPESVVKAMLQPTAPAAPAAKAPKERITIGLPATITPEIDGTYYTRFTLHYERETFVTTNYAVGTIVPINTKVTLVSKGRESLELRIVDTGETFKVKNIEKFSGKDIDGIAQYMLSAEPTPIEKLPDDISKAIQTGELRLGMTKQQAILARGYPPAHATPSTDGCDRWVYWSSRFVKLTIVFQDGALVEGRGLR